MVFLGRVFNQMANKDFWQAMEKGQSRCMRPPLASVQIDQA